jgi:hypothetical protein
MRNYWVQRESWQYAWDCTVDPRQVSVAALRDFAIASNELLEREQLLEVQTFTHARGYYAYRRAEHGSMAAYCRWLFDNHNLVQFPFGDVHHDNKSTTKVAYYNREDALVEASVADLGLLLRDLEPVPGAILGYLRRRGGAPIEATGTVFPADVSRTEAVGFQLTTRSNIWAPYLYWTGHPWGAQPGVYYDNRELAQHHSTRLNRVISTLADMTAELGGTWTLCAEDSGEFATDRGIDLDPVLAGKLADGAELTPWPDRFEEDGIPMVERDYECGM